MVSAVSDEIAGLSMANSDYFILEALQRLNWERCTYADIVKASKVKCNVSTVWRALNRLQTREVIEQVSRSKQGCVYRLKEKRKQ